MSKFLVDCRKCGLATTKEHAREHEGLCAFCVAGKSRPNSKNEKFDRWRKYYGLPLDKSR